MTPVPEAESCQERVYEGNVLLEGHFARPGETRSYRSRQVFSTDGAGRVRLDWTTWAEGEAPGEPESFLVAGGAVFHRDAPEEAWSELGGARARRATLQATSGVPEALVVAGGWSLVVEGGRVVSLAEPWAHPRLGDVADRVAFTWGDGPVPTGVTATFHERDHAFSSDHRLIASSGFTCGDRLAAPTVTGPRLVDEVLSAAPTLVEVGDGLWAVEVEALDTRSLVVEFADHLVLVELGLGSANGEAVVDALRARWPDKPLRTVAFSHHHPHYAGGLRAAIAAGATVLTTPGNEAFVRAVAALPFTLAPDRLATTGAALRLEVFTGQRELADAGQRLVLLDLGPRSAHTDEFVIAWLPRQRVVFEAEQGWAPGPDGPRAGRRAAGFLQWLREEGVDADRFVQSWPMRGVPAVLTRAQLEALAAPPPPAR